MTVKRTATSQKLVKWGMCFHACVPRTLEELLFKLRLCDLNLDRLVYLLLVTAFVVGIILDGRREQRVDECGFPEARLASNLQARYQCVVESQEKAHKDKEECIP